ncbi:MAG: hypothetical protein D6692_08815 [Planctomycetota bacterium]|nr:MAG: hypothetical protein D6692_08815 [Planctomycetota bacterium]
MDLPFAIDDLYSAGWWPGDADICLQASDGRWYPDPDHALAAFLRLNAKLTMTPLTPGNAWRAVWTASTGVSGTVTADDRAAASVLAYAALLRFQVPTPVVAG